MLYPTVRRGFLVTGTASSSLFTNAANFACVVLLGWLCARLIACCSHPPCLPLTTSSALCCDGPSSQVLTSTALPFPLSTFTSSPSASLWSPNVSISPGRLDQGWSATAEGGRLSNSCQLGHCLNGIAGSTRSRSITTSIVGMLNHAVASPQWLEHSSMYYE